MGRVEFKLVLIPNPLFSLMAVFLLRVVSYCFDYSSIHSSDCYDYYASLGPGFGSDSDSNRCYPHTNLIVGAD